MRDVAPYTTKREGVRQGLLRLILGPKNHGGGGFLLKYLLKCSEILTVKILEDRGPWSESLVPFQIHTIRTDSFSYVSEKCATEGGRTE